MSDAPESTSMTTELQQLECLQRRAAIAKLEAETQELVRSWWSRPTYWISLVPVIVASVTLGQLIATGYYDGLRRAIEIDRKKAEHERDLLTAEQCTLRKQQQDLKDRINELIQQEKQLASTADAIAILTSAGVTIRHRGANLEARFADYDDSIALGDLLPRLRYLTNLTWLSFANTELTDEHLKSIGDNKQIKELYLDRTRISDIGMRHLSGLSKLRVLSANSTQLSDGIRVHLGDLKELKRLDLVGTTVTENGADQIRQLLPDCEINR